MRTLLSILIVSLAAALIGAEAYAQSITVSRSVTHSPSIHRGNVSQGAVFVGPPSSRVVPGPIITPNPGHGHGHHRRGHFRRPLVHIHTTACYYTAGHYTTRYEKQYIPPRVVKQYIPPQYEWVIRPDGRRVKILVASGYYRDVVVDGHYTSVPVQVYVPASWSCGYYY
jgi:hypothetical protein